MPTDPTENQRLTPPLTPPPSCAPLPAYADPFLLWFWARLSLPQDHYSPHSCSLPSGPEKKSENYKTNLNCYTKSPPSDANVSAINTRLAWPEIRKSLMTHRAVAITLTLFLPTPSDLQVPKSRACWQRHQCCSRECLWVVVDSKRRYRNIRSEWMKRRSQNNFE